MKSVGTRFLIPFGLLAILGSVFIFSQTYKSSHRHAEELLSQQAAIALQFNLAIRDYAGKKIRPRVEGFVDKDVFMPEVMSTSYISRKIFEKVQKSFPDYIIRFYSENPRNPVNQAGLDEQGIIEFFRQNPQVKHLSKEIKIQGKRFLATFSSRWFTPECMQCHGDPKDAPAELVKRYGDIAGFHRRVGDVAGLDTVAVPIEAINASLASDLRSQWLIMAAGLTLLFLSIVVIFRFVVTRRLVTMAHHFDGIAAHLESPWMTPVPVKGNDEISVVGLAFNKLVEQLRTAQMTLEQRVAERTEDYLWANEQLQRELTERRQAEDALRKSEERYRVLMETASDAIFAADGETGIIVDANQKASELLGIPTAQIIGLRQSELHPPEDVEKYQDLFRQHAARGGIVSDDIYVINNEGRRIPVEISASTSAIGDKQLILGIFRDISKRKRVEEELRTRQAELTTILRAVPVGIGVAIDRELKEVNDQVCTISGYSREELLGKNSRMLYPTQEDYEFVGREYRQILAYGVGTVETRWQQKNGNIVDILLSLTPITEGDSSQSVLFTVTDITERKKMEMEHFRLDKLESLGIMAGGIAHDFNNVLMTILGNISLASLEISDSFSPEAADWLDNAGQGCQQAMVLARQLLTFAKGGAPIKQIHSLQDIIQESASLALSGSRSRHEFSSQEHLWNVNVDRGQIHQVFSNLLINADQAMPLGGMIHIQAQNVELDPSSKVSLPRGKYVLVDITDQGVGIPPEQLAKIFDPYFTTKQKGNGLGLATVFSIVKQHGGLISVKSALGEGTTFQLYLPAAKGRVQVKEEVESKPFMGRGRILVMDDEAPVRAVVGRMLKKMGYDPLLAQDGAEALELYTQASSAEQPIDAVILDLTIPGGMGGKEVIHELLAQNPRVKALVSSGYADDAIMANYSSLGFRGVITKPYTILQLGEVLQKVISG
jgi:two-component system cell cycle sensor histidine kinase/response regulator CckA